MSPAPEPIFRPAQAFALFARYPRRWLLPAAAIVLLAAIYALIRPATWEASQALIVRNEAAANAENPGKFSHTDEMKTLQETILELARSEGVLRAALVEAGPPDGYTQVKSCWPADADVVDLSDALRLSPPKGAEFGRTEVFYLHVRDRDRARAIRLAAAVASQLESRFQTLRDARAQSMTDELARAADLARADLAASTAELKAVEKPLGSDLAELRVLEDPNGGESALRRTATEINAELRAARTALQSHDELLTLLRVAQDDPAQLVAAPGVLLESQPALRQLKAGLVDAQLRVAELQGKLSDKHPLTQNAQEARDEVRRQLHGELATAIRAVEADRRLSVERVVMLENQLDATNVRLQQIAGLRAEYANLVAESQNRAAVLQRAEQALAEARFGQATARAASLISRIDAPSTGPRPIGPSAAMVLFMGLAGGLVAGWGVLLLTCEPARKPHINNIATWLPAAQCDGRVLPQPRRNGAARATY